MYIFDTNSLIVIFTNFYQSRFPSLWEKFDTLISNGRIVSVREVYNEITSYYADTRPVKWAKDNRKLFEEPSTEEMEFVGKIFSIKHFQLLIRKKEILNGKPVADPFVVAKAKIENSIVITQEKLKENAAKIPNVCQHFKIEYMDLEGFMEREGWEF